MAWVKSVIAVISLEHAKWYYEYHNPFKLSGAQVFLVNGFAVQVTITGNLLEL